MSKRRGFAVLLCLSARFAGKLGSVVAGEWDTFVPKVRRLRKEHANMTRPVCLVPELVVQLFSAAESD